MELNYSEYWQFGNLIAITCDGVGSIPIDPSNIDYQRYREWVAEGNTPTITGDKTV